MKNYNKFIRRALSLSLALIMLLGANTSTFAESTNAETDAIREGILKRYVNTINPSDLQGDTPEEIFKNLDKHSAYYNEEQFNQFIESITGEFVGVGIYIKEEKGKVVVSDTIKGSPAEKVGIVANDTILSVDGKDMKGLTTEEVASNIRGLIGTKVKVEIQRGLIISTYTITRDRITIDPIEVEVIDDVGYIKITQFNEHTSKNFLNAMGEIYYQGIDKLIIDVRNNPGGSLDEVAAVSRVLIPKGPIVHVDYKDHRQTYVSLLRTVLFENIVVLVNENSASASEILAGAVQDAGVGTIIGKTTYGKGSVQRVYFLSTGGGFKLTEAIYRTPKGTKIDGVGVVPDIVVERFEKDVDIKKMDIETLNSREYDNQLQEAIKHLSTNSK